MRRNLKYIYIFLLTVILISTGCGESLEQDIVEKSNPYKLDTLKLEGGRDWGMSNPYLQDPRGPGTAKVKLVFDSLLDADEEGIIPWLAKDWEIDGDNYIFTINENSYFHDGEALTLLGQEFSHF